MAQEIQRLVSEDDAYRRARTAALAHLDRGFHLGGEAPPDRDALGAASELEERHRLSFWDALIVVSARRSGARTLLTEDLPDGQRFEGLEVVSPFRDGAIVGQPAGEE